MIKVHRENSKKRREKQVQGSTELGKVEIPALILESGQGNEKWSVYTPIGFFLQLQQKARWLLSMPSS